MRKKELGKISRARFGFGGYQGCAIGLHLQFRGESWVVGTNISTWAPEKIECSEDAEWTEETRAKTFDRIIRKVSEILSEANVKSVQDLEGIPVECEFVDRKLEDWRILAEVLFCEEKL